MSLSSGALLANRPFRGGPFAPVYNVKSMFGAYGDGVHDDTAAIQAAVDACGTGGGGRVFVPSEPFLISSTILVPYSGVQIVGVPGPTGKEGMTPNSGSRLIAASGAFGDHSQMIYFGNGVTSDIYVGSGIRGLNLLSNGSAEGAWLINIDQGLVLDVYVNNAYSTGLFAAAVNNTVDSVRILRCKVSNTQGGTNTLNGIATPTSAISLGGAVYYSVIGLCSVISNLGDGISLGGTAQSAGTGCKLIQCNADSTTGNQFLLAGGYLIFRGNTTFNPAGKSALLVYGGEGHIISGNLLQGANSSGTQTGGNGAVLYNNSGRINQIRNNIIGVSGAGSPTAGIYEQGVNSGSGCLYENNDLRGVTVPVTIASGPSVSTFRNNAGYNPVGSSVPATAFALPASGTAWTNNTGVDGTLHVTAAGTVTDVVLHGVTVGSSLSVGQSFFVPAGGTITLTYTTAPTLVFVGN